MTSPSARVLRDDDLGGRLPLLDPTSLGPDQRQVYDALTAIVVPEAVHHGFTARLADGRFVGPFNALLRAPSIALGMGQWTARIAEAGLAADVRQAVILTVGTSWGADYEIDAHRAAARAAGIPAAAITAITQRRAPAGLSPDADLAHRLTRCLLEDHAVSDALYEEARAAFGDPGLVALMCLIGQYLTISAILVLYRVPVPSRAASVGSHRVGDHP